MYLERLYDEQLAQASWLVGCGATGQALVVDPNRDVERYVRAAAAQGFRITHVTETHIHADFVSGARELAKRVGAELLLSGEGDGEWKYRYPSSDYTVLRDADVIRVGNLRLDVVHTPGHTPEHLAFLLTDGVAADRPMGMFTGDFVFAGDVGRPDLLERTALAYGTAEAMARSLYASLRRLGSLPDWLQLWPGHGAGSACGKSLGAVPSTTLGYERAFNWAFRAADAETFVEAVLAGQPEAPPYFAVMKRVNRDGPAAAPVSVPAHADADALESCLRRGAFVLDTRPTTQFAAAHIPGTIALPAGRSFLNYAGQVVPYDRDIVVIVRDDEPDASVAAIAKQLALIGVDRVVAGCGSAGVDLWREAGGSTSSVVLMQPAEVAERPDVHVLDVRGASEWADGHIARSTRLYLGDLAAMSGPIATSGPLVLTCQSGSRSVIGASLLRARGVADVRALTGGIDAWRAAGLPITSG